MTRFPGKGWRRDIVLSGVLVVLHLVMRQILVRHDVVSSVFAAGDHVPVAMLAVAAVFAAVRLAVVLVLPGYWSYRVLDWVLGKGMRSEKG